MYGGNWLKLIGLELSAGRCAIVCCARLLAMLRTGPQWRGIFAIKLHALREPTMMGAQRRRLAACVVRENLGRLSR